MATYSNTSYISKLSKLSDSAQSIQTLSHWVQFSHRKATSESSSTWAQEALKAAPARQLLFIYLANDIMQNSRRKGPEFIRAYGAQLPAVMPKIYHAAAEPIKEKLLRLLAIWEERRVVASDVINQLRERMDGGSGGQRAAQPPPPSSSTPAASHATATSNASSNATIGRKCSEQ